MREAGVWLLHAAVAEDIWLVRWLAFDARYNESERCLSVGLELVGKVGGCHRATAPPSADVV